MHQLWTSLARVHSLSFIARSSGQTGWNGHGAGSVAVDSVAPNVIIFAETGSWRPVGGKELRFTNTFRWTLLEPHGFVQLEHLRFGVDQPVYLFELSPVTGSEWVSTTPQFCRDDCYSARLQIGDDLIQLAWTIKGPNKAEEIQYAYYFNPGPFQQCR
jgi:hypothetical protein